MDLILQKKKLDLFIAVLKVTKKNTLLWKRTDLIVTIVQTVAYCIFLMKLKKENLAVMMQRLFIGARVKYQFKK